MKFSRKKPRLGLAFYRDKRVRSELWKLKSTCYKPWHIYKQIYTHTLRSTPTHQPWQQKHLSFASPSGSFSSYWSSRQHSGSLSSGGHLPYSAKLWRMLAGFTAKNQVRRQDKAKKAQRNHMCNSTFPPKIYILYLLPPNQNSLKTGYARNFSSTTPRVLDRRHVYAHLDIM